jgi:hypothetical protein
MTDFGLDLQPGDHHYRAYVGPPADYDLIAANAFCLLSSLGLRADHRLTDIGCGSLRIGRLLIPFLNSGMYTGVEPNQWLVEEAIEKEVGNDQVRIKAPVFHFRGDAQGIPAHSQRWALAQSIFSHCGPDLLDIWVKDVAGILSPEGSLVATFVEGATDTASNGWLYPACNTYSWTTIKSTCARHGLRARLLGWPHPRQSWFVATAATYHPGFYAHLPFGVRKLLRTLGTTTQTSIRSLRRRCDEELGFARDN